MKFEFDFDYAAQVQKMFARTYDSIVVAALKRILSKKDIFFDIGANIGYLSAVGADLVGVEGGVYSFEPSPREFERLKKLASLNPEYKIHCNSVACGEDRQPAKLDISKAYGWNTLVPAFMRQDVYQNTIDVPMVRLDEYISANIPDPGRIKLIKIDVEGFEYYVLRGLKQFFLDGFRPAIVCEITPRGNDLMGIPLNQIEKYMDSMGYETVSLIDFKSKIDLAHLPYQNDVLFLMRPALSCPR